MVHIPSKKEVKFVLTNYPVHNLDCMKMKHYVAFLAYLCLHVDSEDPTMRDETSSKGPKPYVVETKVEEEDKVFDLISPLEERKLPEDFDVVEFKASTVIDVNSTTVS